MRKKFFGLTGYLLPGVFLLASSCSKPVINSLSPVSGPTSTLVNIAGSELTGAQIFWDYGLPSQKVIPSGGLSFANYFSVPPGSSLGSHPIKLALGTTFSDNTLNFTVTQKMVSPKPRIDYLTCESFSIDAQGNANFFLVCSGANIDVGAKFRINGVVQPALVHQVLHNAPILAADPTTLGYPIDNYISLWAPVTKQKPGISIVVEVINLDGQTDAMGYAVAASMATLDSDGDGLLDDWENHGYDADGDGVVDVDLKALGAKPNHKDIFVEVDWMKGYAPSDVIWSDIVNCYANAPIWNSDGAYGITLHVDHGQPGGGGGGGSTIPASKYIRYDGITAPFAMPGQGTVKFNTLKTANFNTKKLKIFRYCIFADQSGFLSGSSGQAEAVWSNDFYISLGEFRPTGNLATDYVGTFLHELGHTLNLYHGGFEDVNLKPPYNSIMRYGTPGQLFGIDVTCSNTGGNLFTYSQGMRTSLDETNLSEPFGVCDHKPVDWNHSGLIDAAISADINGDGNQTVLKDYADWGNLKLNFTTTNSKWNGN